MRTTIVVLGLVLSGCAGSPDGGLGSPGSSAGTVATQTPIAQRVGRDQGAASAAETGAASNNVTPIVINALAAKTVVVKQTKGGAEVRVEGQPDATVTVEGASFGNFSVKDHWSQDAETSSGGGAAGGTGGAERGASTSTTGGQ